MRRSNSRTKEKPVLPPRLSFSNSPLASFSKTRYFFFSSSEKSEISHHQQLRNTNLMQILIDTRQVYNMLPGKLHILSPPQTNPPHQQLQSSPGRSIPILQRPRNQPIKDFRLRESTTKSQKAQLRVQIRHFIYDGSPSETPPTDRIQPTRRKRHFCIRIANRMRFIQHHPTPLSAKDDRLGRPVRREGFVIRDDGSVRGDDDVVVIEFDGAV